MPDTSKIEIRSATDTDWPAIAQLDATNFLVPRTVESFDCWRSLIPTGGSVVACDGGDVVATAHFFDMHVTVPGGAVLPMAGLTITAVAPTHRRRGLLRDMYTELHHRVAAGGYPLAGLTASEGGIYGRFGYGPSTTIQEYSIARRFARFRSDVPDPGGVRIVKPAEHRDDFAEVYERWRQDTPGGLTRPPALWDDLLADNDFRRHGGTEFYAFLHPDAYALYRVHHEDQANVRVEEITAATVEGAVAVWRALLGLDLVEKVVYGTHPADPLPYLLTDPRLARTTDYVDDLWLRIMDIQAALEARGYSADLSSVIEVSDEFRCDGGTFALDIKDGRATCKPTDAAADVRMSLDVLGSLYFGGHRASAFAAVNRLHSKDSETVARLDAAFVSDVPAELGYGF